MDASIPRVQGNFAMPPVKALLKALAFGGMAGLGVASGFWILEALGSNLHSEQRLASLIFGLVVFLALTPVMYYSFRRGLWPSREESRRLSVFKGILGACLAIGFVISLLRGAAHNPYLALGGAILYSIETGASFRRAFKSKPAV